MKETKFEHERKWKEGKEVGKCETIDQGHNAELNQDKTNLKTWNEKT